MRDITNLSWPEGPFGADQRPFGRRNRILMAIALEMDDRVAVAATAVYLRMQRNQILDVRSDTLNLGFRATVAEDAADEADLLELIDRALVRGRRHAFVLAGHGLGRDLARLPAPGDRRLPGVIAVAEAWAGRRERQRGMATMIDTQEDVDAAAAPVDVALRPVPRQGIGEPGMIAACSLTRCIAIGLKAAANIGAYRWDGCFPVRRAAEAAAWDRMEHVEWAGLR
jgi:hypothetical protein